ncbi:MAG TPA: hypothetical protein VMH28_33580 [Candidatus Acidoferrales bacterium]|nr:hypothetical protein [Candidatus Acidoferrales bacterium]
MKAIVVTEDDLRRLEKQFGPGVRHMGPWYSDGTFGYLSVPLAGVEKAVEASANSGLAAALGRIRETPDPSGVFIESLQTFGAPLIDRIVAAYRERSLPPQMARSSAAGSRAA